MKRVLSKSPTAFLRISAIPTLALTATLLSLSGGPVSASPPTPREVANHVHKRVSGIFYKVARVIEGGPTEEEESNQRRSKRQKERYLDEDRSTGIRNPELEPYTPPPVYDSDRDREPRYLPPHNEEDERRRTEAQRETYYRQEQRNFDRQRSQSQSRTEYYTPDLAPPEEPLDRRRDSNSSSDQSNPGLNLRQRGSTSGAVVPPSDGSGNTRRPVEQSDARRKPDTQTQSSEANKQSSSNGPKATYATPVPNREGFVYPPGVKQEASNMLDVRGLTSGQKARDPKTGAVFLVP